MSNTNDKDRRFPLPFDGAYPNREESGDFRKVEEDEDMFDEMSDADDANFSDMPPSPKADGDENHQDEQEERSRKNYRDNDMIEETRK